MTNEKEKLVKDCVNDALQVFNYYFKDFLSRNMSNGEVDSSKVSLAIDFLIKFNIGVFLHSLVQMREYFEFYPRKKEGELECPWDNLSIKIIDRISDIIKESKKLFYKAND